MFLQYQKVTQFLLYLCVNRLNTDSSHSLSIALVGWIPQGFLSMIWVQMPQKWWFLREKYRAKLLPSLSSLRISLFHSFLSPTHSPWFFQLSLLSCGLPFFPINLFFYYYFPPLFISYLFTLFTLPFMGLFP